MEYNRTTRLSLINNRESFNVINASFEKIAKLTEDEKKEYAELTPKVREMQMRPLKKAPGRIAKNYAGMGGIYGGAALVNSARRSGELDGLVRRYHNTKAENVKGIKEQGILSSKALDKNNLTNMLTGLPEDQVKGKTYLAKNRSFARGAGTRRQQVEDAIGSLLPPNETQSMFKGFKNQKTLKVNIPLSEYKKMNIVANPELRGATTFKDVLKKGKAGELPVKKMSDAAIMHFMVNKGTDTVSGDIASKFIKGGKGYQKQTLKDIKNHIKNNPKMFTKGLGKAGLGTAGLAASGYLISKNIKDISKDKKELKNSADMKRYKELSDKIYNFK